MLLQEDVVTTQVDDANLRIAEMNLKLIWIDNDWKYHDQELSIVLDYETGCSLWTTSRRIFSRMLLIDSACSKAVSAEICLRR